MSTDSLDLIVVGSGPAGATIARTVFDQRPAARILMVEVGPQVTPLAGMCARNLPSPERVDAEHCSQGPRPAESKPVPGAPGGQLPRPGTFLIDGTADFSNPVRDMPGAVMSACVGGQGTHWSGMCPRPGNAERIPFIADEEMDEALSAAERLLRVTPDAYPPSSVRDSVERVLGEHFNASRPRDRWVQPMPMAATPVPGGRPYWWGSDAILGDLAGPATRPAGYELRNGTLARRLLHDGGTVEGIQLQSVSTGTRTTVSAKVVAVAADPFRTPQLLWASGIRPASLGHYLNDQPRVTGVVTMHAQLVSVSEQLPEAANQRELVSGISWIPFHSPDFPFSGTIAQHEAKISANGTPADRRPTVSLGCFTTKQARYDDWVEFSETTVDPWGMPAIRIHYDFSQRDRAAVEEAKKIVKELMPLIGEPAADGTVRMAPAGTSIHYQGTVRMGPENDGTSVCDAYGKVWGTTNLFVAGNGVIPTETACNPTLTSVALAVRSGQRIAAML